LISSTTISFSRSALLHGFSYSLLRIFFPLRYENVKERGSLIWDCGRAENKCFEAGGMYVLFFKRRKLAKH
jgi:hypothetical protein